MNKVDFVVDLSQITLIEPVRAGRRAGQNMFVCLTSSQRVETMSDGSAFHACALSWGRDLALMSAGSEAETDDLQQLVTAWARFYCGAATESPRSSPRRGQLRGYLLRVTRGPPERLWTSQVSGDALSLYPVRGKEAVATIDMAACARCSFDRVLLQFVLHEGDRQHVFRCESEESYVP
jgi:hypothetical protein